MENFMTTCSVVMVSYHTGPVLFAAVKSVLKQQQLSEFIVVNNGNPPDVLARLQQMALGNERLRIISGHGNAGFAKGCNIGAAQAAGDYLLLLNPDCLLPPQALADTMTAFDEIPGAALAGCWLQNPDGSEQRGGRRQLLTPKTALAEALSLHLVSGKFTRLNNHRMAMPGHTHEVEAISGAFMCMRLEHYRKLGGLDEGFFLHVEDLDFCMRVHQAGGKIICVPGVQVTHMLSTSGEAPSRVIEWHKTKGFIRYFDKHFRKETALPLLWLLYAAAWARFALRAATGTVRKHLRLGHVMVRTTASKRLMALASGLADLHEKQDWEGRKVLVTGATSQVGLCVIRRLLMSGAGVVGLSRGKAIPFQHERLYWLQADLADPSFRLPDIALDMAVHCAPLWHLPPVMNQLAATGVKRIVAFGSTSVFGKALSRNASEKKLVARLARAEADLTAQCALKNIQWTLLRPTLIYGLGLDANITALARLADRMGFLPVYPPASGRRQPVHVDDLAMATLAAANAPAAVDRAYNLSGGEIVTYRAMLERLFFVLGRKPWLMASTLLPFLLDMAGWLTLRRHLNGEIARRMNDDLVFFHDDATKDFGFHPRPYLSGGLKDIEGF